MILLAASACDNVEWGGIDVHLDSPAEAADTAAAAEEEAPAAEATGPVLPSGPTLFAANLADGNRVFLRPVAAVGTDSLVAIPGAQEPGPFWERFAAERLAPGAAFTLFAEGARVGTVRVDRVTFEPGRCGSVPVASGVLEIVPDAAGTTRFVALDEGAGEPRAFQGFTAPGHTYDQRVAGLGMATDAIGRLGATWPEMVLETRADMQALPLDGDPGGAFAATFLFQDALRVGPPLTAAAWGIFVLGTASSSGFDLAFLDYRPVADGKAAIRYFEQADWDGDGRAEILLEVFGEEASWMAALDRRGDGWVRVFEESCGPSGAGA